MKIACQSCQAKYTIADEKVLGKVVKIRCKKCGATIVVNGQEDASLGASGHNEEATEVRSSSSDLGQGGEEAWTVNVADDDQRTMSTPQIAAEFANGTVNDETYCWRDGMGDWLPLKEIEELAQACGLMGGGFAQPPVAAAIPARAPVAASGGGAYGAAAASPAVTATARRAGGRAPAADLFGAAAEAGGENDVMTSAPQNPNNAHDDGKMTGQRNENSVLFSLNALTATAPAKKNETTAQGDGSGLIDIRALSSAMASTGPKKANHADDIMNLGGGGAFSAALAAPVLTAPPLDSHDMGPGSAAAQSNKKLLLIAGGIAAFFIVAMFGMYLAMSPKKVEPVAAAAGAESAASAATPPGPAAPAGGTATAPAVAANEPAAAGGAADPKATAPSVGVTRTGGGGGGGSRPSGGGGGGQVAINTTPATPATPAAPRSLEQMMGGAVGAKPAAPAAAPAGGGTDPFDRGAAAGSLGSIDVSGCKKPDGPTGAGHVSITFSPSGTVSTAVVDQPPFAGTSVGGCVAGKFRSAHVPPFSGGPTKVGKSFIIN